MNDITDTKKEMAENLLYSLRGRYLIERAVVSLVRELNQVKGVHKEVGDITDLTLIRTQLLNTFPDSTFERSPIMTIVDPYFESEEEQPNAVV